MTAEPGRDPSRSRHVLLVPSAPSSAEDHEDRLPGQAGPAGQREGQERRADAGVAANARLTATNAAVLLALLAAEGVTVLPGPRAAHAARVHRHDARPAGAAQGGQHRLAVRPLLPRRPGLPAQGPAAVAAAPARPGPWCSSPLVLLASGIGLLLASSSWLPLLLKVRKASFVLWFGAMTIHVLGHLGEVLRLAPRDWLRRTRRDVTGAGPRQSLIAASLVAGWRARVSPAQPRRPLAGLRGRR